MFETWYKMATMLQGDLDISAIITHRFHVDQYQEAFDVMRLGQSGKVLLEW
jgi:threonine 3-dehydrogenase